VPDNDITSLLRRWSGGDDSAVDELLPLVYTDLRQLAQRSVRLEREGHTLSATALVNEAYLRLTGENRFAMENRAQFFHLTARIMRSVLIDYARRRRSGKRGGRFAKIEFDEAFMAPVEKQEEWLAVDLALERFAALDPARAQLVELRYFAGFTLEEVAELEGCSLATVKRDWALARGWLRRELSERGSLALDDHD